MKLILGQVKFLAEICLNLMVCNVGTEAHKSNAKHADNMSIIMFRFKLPLKDHGSENSESP